MKKHGFLVLFLVVLLVACGGQAPFKVSPETASTTASGDRVTLTASGAAGTVTWSLSPELGSLSATSGASVEYIPPERVETSQTVTVTATSGSASASTTISVEPLIVDVNGVLLDFNNKPISGVGVLIPGKDIVTTDSDGGFAFSDVIAPYDVIVQDSASDYRVYTGLTKPEPFVYSNTSSGTFSAHISGSVNNTTSGNKAGVEFVSDSSLGSWGGSAGAGSTSYALDVTMLQPTDVVDAYALEWTVDSDGHPLSFVNHASAEAVALAESGSFTVDFGTVESVNSTETLNTSVTTPSNTTLSYVSAGVVFGESRIAVPIVTDVYSSPSSSTFTLLSPGLLEAKMRVAAWAQYSATSDLAGVAWYSVPATAGGLGLAIPTAPAQLTPADGSASVTPSTEFSWEACNEGVSMVFFSGPISISLLTGKTSATLPDLSKFGVSYNSGDSYTWRAGCIFASGQYDSMEQLTSAGTLNPFTLGLVAIFGVTVTDSGYLVQSPRKAFSIQ